MPSLINAIFLLGILFLQSCVEGDEEIWIEPDGSGRLAVHYSIPSLALQKSGNPDHFIRALKLIDEKEPGIEIQRISFEVTRGKAVFKLEATFDEISDLFGAAERSGAAFDEEADMDADQLDLIVGDVAFGFPALHPSFKRSVELGPVFPSMVRQNPAMLGSSNFKYVLHLPYEVQETNAHQLSPDRKTVTWDFKLKDNLDIPMVMSVKTAIPVPWWGWIILALLLLTFLLIITALLRRGVRRKMK